MKRPSPPPVPTKPGSPATLSKNVYFLAGLLALAIVVIVTYSQQAGDRMVTYFTPLIDATMEIKLEVTTSHLLLEEIVNDDSDAGLDAVLAHLDNALWYGNAMLAGGRNYEGTFLPLVEPDLRARITEVMDSLERFKVLSQKRLALSPETGLASILPQEYHTLFHVLIDQMDAVETALQKTIGSDLNNYHSVQYSLLAILLLLFVTVSAVFYVDEKRRRFDVQALSFQERSLAAEKERLSVTLRSIGDGVITSDIHGNLVLINKVAEKLTGWSQVEAYGRPVAEVFHIINEKTGELCESPVEKVLELGKIIGLANHTALISKDGVQRSIADSGAPIRDMDSNIIGTVLVFRDVTDELKMEEEVLKVKKLESIGILAGGIAHDFNNILSAILGNVSLAAHLAGSGHKVQPLLLEVEKASRRAEKLTKQLLTFSKGGDPVKERTPIAGLIRESADFVLHGSSVSCAFAIPDDLWLVEADQGQLGQVIQNLVINARHAMPEGGKLEVNCCNVEDIVAETNLSMHRGRYVKIAIVDRGVGIPESIIDKVFDPFFSTKQEGSGLGLATCHSIVNKHDGHILVDSEPGKGTVFTIFLPAAKDQNRPDSSPAQMVVKGKGSVMVMDDEKIVRAVAQQMLSHLGYEVEVVENGEQAIALYQQRLTTDKAIDVTIMDLTIPGAMGGEEAARKVLELDPQAKIIVASGYSNDPIMAQCHLYGFRAAVSKPFDLKELSQALKKVLC